jgi:hypothetical protein
VGGSFSGTLSALPYPFLGKAIYSDSGLRELHVDSLRGHPEQ